VRILLDRYHRCIIITKAPGSTEVLGGICFRPFHSQGFAEIVFLAITENEKSKGLGARVMNHCKEHVKTEEIKFFLTFADNTAIGYFVKQGFSKKKTMVKPRWDGFIKEYVRSTLMECKILYNVNYIFLKETIRKQKAAVAKKMEKASKVSDIVYPGLTNNSNWPIKIDDIPGVKETNWHARCGTNESEMGKLQFILTQISKMKAAEPFLFPVQEEHAPNYSEIIKHPMDLGTMEKKLKDGVYQSKSEFIRDFDLMIENCRTYNDASTVYVRYAGMLESKCRSFLAQKFPLG
jgi:histone acetyltransferase